MSKPFATLVPALQGGDPHATASQIFRDLGWRLLDPCPEAPSPLAAVGTRFALAHPAYGIALVDIAPERATAPVERLRTRLELAGFAPDSVPIRYFLLDADDVWRIPTIIDPAFATEPALQEVGTDWIDRAQQALRLAPPGPAPTTARAPTPEPATSGSATPGSARAPVQPRSLNPVWMLLAVGLVSGGLMLQYGGIEAVAPSAPVEARGTRQPAPTLAGEYASADPALPEADAPSPAVAALVAVPLPEASPAMPDLPEASAPAAEAPRVRSAEAPHDMPAPLPPPAASPSVSAATVVLTPQVINRLIARGDEMLARGDVSAARLLYARAADAGSAAAAQAMVRSYDPAALAARGITGIRSDPAAAAQWSRRATELGAR